MKTKEKKAAEEKSEQEDRAYRIYYRLIDDCLDLRRAISYFEKEGADVELLKNAKAVEEGVTAVLSSLGVAQEEEEKKEVK